MIAEASGRDWRVAAACAAPGIDPEVFFPIDSGPAGELAVARAKALCASCPVRAECLADVMAVEDPAERWGVTGGLSPVERAALFERDRHPAPVLVLAPGVQLDLFDLDPQTRKGAA